MSSCPRALVLLVCLVLVGCGSATATPGRAAAPPAPGGPAVLATLPPGGTGSLQPLGRRDAGTVTLRTYRSASTSGSCDRLNEACAPAWCTSDASVLTEVSTAAYAATLRSSLIGVAPGGVLSILGVPESGPQPARGVVSYSGSGVSQPAPYEPEPLGFQPLGSTQGAAEGSPFQLQVVAASPAVARVRLTTPDGVDEAAPTSGVVALAVAGTSTTGTLSALDAAGRELAQVTLPATPTSETPACSPQPPSLPVPGVQPRDPAAAERDIRAAFATAFTHTPTGSYASLAGVEDGAALRGALDQLRSNFPQAVLTSTVTTGKVVFTAPDTAVAGFTLSYNGGAPYGQKNGAVVLQDGRWLVSRDTYCMVLRFGGAQCP